MMTRSFASAAAVSLLVALPARGEFEYELIIIEPWNQTYSLASSGVSGLNNLNQVSGCASTDPLGQPCSFLWTYEGGKMPINLAGLINDNGVIVATNTIRWPDGTLQEIDGACDGVGDINNANVIAGSTGGVGICPSGSTGGSSDAAVWDPVNGSLVLGQAFGIFADDEAWAINEHNQLVGVRTSTGLCGDHKAFILDLGTGAYTDLHALVVGTGSGITEAYDINDAGVVVGEGPFGNTVRPFLWSADDGFSFPPPPAGSEPDFTHFYGINNAGVAVGGAIVGDFEWHGIIWDETNGTRDLNDLVERPEGFLIRRADRINDNGWIIGYGFAGSWNPSRAVVLRPLTRSEPRSADLDGDGMIGVDDLVAVMLAWGACPELPTPCPADLDGSGAVDVDDLVRVMLEWS